MSEEKPVEVNKEEDLKTPVVDVSKVEDKVVLNDEETKQIDADADKALADLDAKRKQDIEKELVSLKETLSKEFDSKLAAIKESYDKELNDIKSQRKGIVNTESPFAVTEKKEEEIRPPTLDEFKAFIGRR